MNIIRVITFINVITLCYCLDSQKSTEIKHKDGGQSSNSQGKNGIKLGLDISNIILPKITQHRQNKKPDGDILLRQTRRLTPIPNNQNKFNNDNIKLRLNLNGMMPKIPQQRPNMVQKPITNLRPRSRPIALPNNRIRNVNQDKNQPRLSNPVKSAPAIHPEPPKDKNETTIVKTEAKNITEPVTSPKIKFYIETDNDVGNVNTNDTNNTQFESLIIDKVLEELNKEYSECLKHKTDEILELIKDMPNIIRNITSEKKESENPIVIRNITEINISIMEGIKTHSRSKANDEDEQMDKTRSNDKRFCKDLIDLLLKSISKTIPNKTESTDLPKMSLVDDAKNERVTAKDITQNNCLKIVEKKKELPCKMKEKVELPEKGPSLVPIAPQNSNPEVALPYTVQQPDLTLTIPCIQVTPPPLDLKVYSPDLIYTVPACEYPNVYTSDGIFTNPYVYNYNQQTQPKSYDGLLPNDRICKEGVNSLQNSETKWKNWSNNEIVINTNDDHGVFVNQMQMLSKPNQYQPRNNNCMYQNSLIPMSRNYPYYIVPNLYVA